MGPGGGKSGSWELYPEARPTCSLVQGPKLAQLGIQGIQEAAQDREASMTGNRGLGPGSQEAWFQGLLCL